LNVLVTSLSRKVPLVEALRSAVDGSGLVWGGDTDAECVGRHFVDRFWEMPPLDEADVAGFCAREEIGLLVPSRDGELATLARMRDDLDGTWVAVGAPGAVETCLDKQAFHDHCRQVGVPVAPTAAGLDAIDADLLVVKGRRGAGSRGLAVGVGREAAAEFAGGLDEPIFQPLLDGVEHSIDLYVNREGAVVEAAPRTRIRVHDGESTVTETVEHPGLVDAAVRLAASLELRGHAVIQAFADGDDVTVLECNPRVGGASTLGFHAGVESPRWAIAEAGGETVQPRLGDYRRGLRLVRYPSDRLIEP
jgi:carbamoyl-phosphate synthase large subunit